jgi:hypothetical protein
MNTKKDTAVFHIDHVYEIDYSYPGVSRLTDDDDAKPFPIDTLRSAMESICPSNFKNEEERRAAWVMSILYFELTMKISIKTISMKSLRALNIPILFTLLRAAELYERSYNAFREWVGDSIEGSNSLTPK